jgi:hypothetical protein
MPGWHLDLFLQSGVLGACVHRVLHGLGRSACAILWAIGLDLSVASFASMCQSGHTHTHTRGALKTSFGLQGSDRPAPTRSTVIHSSSSPLVFPMAGAPAGDRSALQPMTSTASCLTSLHMTQRDATMQHVGPATAGMTARDQLDAVLDDMRVRGELLFGNYVVLSCLERRGGGQGCVQFVHDPIRRRDFAVKFFFKLDAFKREAALYADPVLRAMMAATRNVYSNADAALRSPKGYAFPPHIVIERGEPLDEWIKRMIKRAASGALPLVAICQALINIAERLMLLHKEGYVHCDIKPSNVLWLADMHAWTLIDFGSTSKAGMLRRLLHAVCVPALCHSQQGNVLPAKLC